MYLFHVDFEGAAGLALGAGTGPCLLVLPLVEGAENEAAPQAVVLDHTELR